MLSENGIFATQIPLFEEMPANQCIIKAEEIFADKFKGIEEDKYVLHSASEYYDMAAKCTNKIEMWITDYCHEMDNHGKILEYLKGASSTVWKVMAMTIPVPMLMYGKEASNRKQKIDRRHHTIPNKK